MRRNLSSLIVLLLVSITSIVLYSATGTPSNLVVRTDANNALIVTSVTQVNPVTQGIFSSRTLRTDSSGNLQVILSGTVTPTYPQTIPASTCAAPSLGLSGNTDNGIAFTASPSILNCIEGTAVMTISNTGVLSTTSNIQSGGSNLAADSATIGWTNNSRMVSSATGLWVVRDNAASFGVQINTGTAAPTVTSCGTGTVTTGSRNTTGQITATGATACTVTFGAPAWTNTPFCTITLAIAPTTTPYISAASTTAITVSGLTAGDIFNYHCLGRI